MSRRTRCSRWFLLGSFLLAVSACGGASKPPLQPDTDPTTSLGDGGADPAAPAAPAPPK